MFFNASFFVYDLNYSLLAKIFYKSLVDGNNQHSVQWVIDIRLSIDRMPKNFYDFSKSIVTLIRNNKNSTTKTLLHVQFKRETKCFFQIANYYTG